MKNKTKTIKSISRTTVIRTDVLIKISSISLLTLCLVGGIARHANAESAPALPLPSMKKPAFIAPQMPQLPSANMPASSSEIDDSVTFIDRFFSSAPILEDDKTNASDDKENADKDAADKVKKKPTKTKYRYKRKRIKTRHASSHQPNFTYKSQILPSEVYKKKYTGDNLHLPKAVYKSDLTYAMLHAAKQGDIPAMRALNRRGVPLSVQDENGNSLLTIATQHGQRLTSKWLRNMNISTL